MRGGIELKKALTNWIVPILAVVLTCFFPCAFLYFENIGEASFADLFPAFFFYLLCAGGIFLVLWLLLRSIPRAALLTAAAVAFLTNFVPIAKAFQRVTTAVPLKGLLAAVVLLLAGLCVWFYKKKPDVRPLCAILFLTLTALTLLNFGMNFATLRAKLNYKPTGVAVDKAAGRFTKEQPNVYLFVFDEYAGAENLENYYHYSNEDFLTAMEARGFTVSRNSYNRESCSTDTIMPNLLNLQYVTDDKTEIGARAKWLRWPLLYQIFDENGYRINLVNQTGFLDEWGVNVLCSTQRQTVSDLAFQNSIFTFSTAAGRMLGVLERRKEVPNVTGYRDADVVLQALDAAENAWKHTDGKTLTVSYIQSPHACFYFRADGTRQNGEKELDWVDQSVYLEQLKYINSRILKIVDGIQANDPDALIIVESDHGARYPNHLKNAGLKKEAEALDSNYVYNILNCVYYRGEAFPISGESGINTLVTVLNQALGTKLPYQTLEQ